MSGAVRRAGTSLATLLGRVVTLVWIVVPYVTFVFLGVLFSVSFLAMKKAALGFDPAVVGCGRTLGGATLLSLVWLASRRGPTFGRQDWAMLAFVAAAGFAWPFYIQPKIIASVGSGAMAMIVGMVPLLTVILQSVWLKVRPSPRQIVGVLAAIGCMGLLFRDALGRKVPAIDLALAATVPICYAVTNVKMRTSLSHVSPLQATAVALWIATALLATPALLAAPRDVTSEVWKWSLAAILLLGFAHAGLGSWLFNKLVHENGPLFAGMMTNVVPVGATLWGAYDQEAFGLTQWIALVGIVVSVALVQIGALQSAVIPDPTVGSE